LTLASNPPGNAARAPRSVRAFLLGCAQAVAWFLLMILERLVEEWLGIVHYEGDAGLSSFGYFVLFGSVFFALILGVTRMILPPYFKARPVTFLLLGWVAGVVVACLLIVLFVIKYGLAPPPGAG
jgi:hypothetical protein